MKIAYSPCPNDTFLFGAWAQGLVPGAPHMSPTLADVETLNDWCLSGEPDLCKISMALLPEVLSHYILLPVGCALGRGVGPKVIARESCTLEELQGKKVAIPGRHTTACLLLMGFMDGAIDPYYCTYDEVEGLLAQEVVEAGVIIHETRFTFRAKGFVEVADLGGLWEKRCGLPVPLGGLVVKRSLDKALVRKCVDALRRSLSLATKRPELCRDYILQQAREKDVAIVERHIATYVSQETQGLGHEGVRAIEMLMSRLGYKASEEWLWSES